MTRLEAFSFLGLSIEATLKEAHEAYKSTAARLHPDAGGSVDEFTKLQDAYAQVKAFLSQPVQCERCLGKGKTPDQHGFVTRWLPCYPCDGSGWITPKLE